MAGNNTIWIPGQEDAPTLAELLGPEPTGLVPVFRSQTSELDVWRIAFLIAGILIGRMLK